jgi:hypothetical protein
MQQLHYLAPERLSHIPLKHRAAHEFCFRTHDQMTDLLVQYEQSGVQHWVSDAVQKALDEQIDGPDEVDLVQLLKSDGLERPYKHYIVCRLVLSLTSDLLHFIYEALSCFEKRKFSVGFALLRKPLKENLLFLAWILGDTNDFISRFEANNSKTLGGTLEPQRLEILRKAIALLPMSEAFNPDLIHEIIFSKTNPNGFEPVWQRASHLITSQGSLLKTGDYDINFVFNDPASDRLYEHLYGRLPYVMIFAMQIVVESFSLVLKGNERTLSYLALTTMGCYESLFISSRKQHVSRALNKALKPFLKCIQCDAPFQIKRSNATEIYLHETVQCEACGLPTQLPLYWLLAIAGAKIDRSAPIAPLLGI